ncbi:uncharacterized protein SAPINGB_P004162 [Magnusiomyces paraingens]|uniref:Membrane anchor Opy2 N-terminal domain-containing protein n=1 Tax=Magnusiomyces paraingens TaxID=2606893 RepID=A0A5E8BU28_9ASCO|nr:uncharacterized protein SAPINGB_P004162 [Saprochaete ingens]VVT54611.1 unnamed protein product [Saprochaete ingens]
MPLALKNLFQRACVVCSDVPSCPTCSDDEICQMTTQSCDSCPTTYCAKVSTTSSSSSSSSSSTTTTTNTTSTSSSSDTGAIVGGAVGGVAAIAIVVALVWWFYVRPRRRNRHNAYLAANSSALGTEPVQAMEGGPLEYGAYAEDEMQEKEQNTKEQIPGDRTTTMSQFSISTASLDRSSTVIPIAYIPGVTTRVGLTAALTPIPGTPPSSVGTPDRSSIATANYRGSTAAMATATTVTAIPARPMLVDIGSGTSTTTTLTNVDQITGTPRSPGGISVTPVAPAGRALTGLGLQADLIPEEEYDDDDDDEYQVHQVRRVGPAATESVSSNSARTHTQGALSSSSDIIVQPIPASDSDSDDSSSDDSSESESDEDGGYEIHEVSTTTITSMAQRTRPGLVTGTPVGAPNLAAAAAAAAATTSSSSLRTSPTNSFVSYKSAREENSSSSSTRDYLPPRHLNPREDGPPLTSPFDDKFHI